MLSDAERDRLVALGATAPIVEMLTAWVAEDPARHLTGRVCRVVRLDEDGSAGGDVIEVATATGLLRAVWDLAELPAVGDWALLADGEPAMVVARVPDDAVPARDAERADRRRAQRSAAYQARRDDPAAQRRNLALWKAREADGRSRARHR